MKNVVCSLVAAMVGAAVLQGANSNRLASQLDCLREKHLAVVAAHRGQSDPSAAENAMSSFRATLAASVPFLEIDVARTRDGVLVLMHDDTLDRTTTGTGAVSDNAWAEIQKVSVRRPDGTVLGDHVPTLKETLTWGRRAGARFEIDVKPTTPFDEVIAAVKAAKMEDHVLIVTYTLKDAVTVHRLDRNVMISVTVDSPQMIDAARKAIDSTRMLGWTGNTEPRAGLFEALRADGIEPIFGTLGRAKQRLDDQYAADGDPSEYRDLVREGVVMIASDTAVVAQRAIGNGYRACLK